MSIIGLTSAYISARHSNGGKSYLLSMNTAPDLATDRPSEPRPNLVAKSAPVDVPKASLEPLQAPVPLLLKPRQAAKPPTGDPAGTPGMGDSGTVESSIGPDPAGESAARAAVEADGYKSVRILGKGDGVWRAKALRGKTEVLLLVDSNGAVTTAD
ncbi:MAG: hypothetical protein AB7F22_36840 [Reyranella sp.]